LSSRGDRSHYAYSPTLDGGQAAHWGRLSWQGIAGKGKLKWSVRGGNSSVPDDSWTEWSRSWTAENQNIDLEPCRFLQWRVSYPHSVDLNESWVLTQVSVSAWQDNHAPVIAKFRLEQLMAIEGGSMLGGSENVTQLFKSGLFAEFSRKSAGETASDPALVRLSRPVHVFSWEATDGENDRLLFSMQYRKLGTGGWRNIFVDSSDNIGSWDTSEVMDGDYEVRLQSSDQRDNPQQLALSATRILGPFQVDNKPPVIDSLRLERVATGFRVRFVARDDGSDVAAAKILLPDGTVERLDPKDGICDSSREEFDAVLTWPRPGTGEELSQGGSGSWLVGIGIQDRRGNFTAAEGEVR